MNSKLRQLYYRHILHRNRLQKVRMVDIGAPISVALSLYGEPVERCVNKDFPEACQFTFSAGVFHDVVLSEWRQRIQSIAYWSKYPDPSRDLTWMFHYYGEGHKWRAWGEPGYSYKREDGLRWLWCSAAPVIGIATSEYMDAEREYKRRVRAEQNDRGKLA